MNHFTFQHTVSRERSRFLVKSLRTLSKRTPSVGKRIRKDTWIHSSEAVNTELSAILFPFLIDEEILDDIVIRYSLQDGNLSLLHYPGFHREAHPGLCCSVRLDFGSARSNTRSYNLSANHPILHRKELLVSQSHPHYNEFRKITQSEEKLGLLRDKSKIGWSEYWHSLLTEKDLEITSHELHRR
jgi:hypothetical protein